MILPHFGQFCGCRVFLLAGTIQLRSGLRAALTPLQRTIVGQVRSKTDTPFIRHIEAA